MKLSNILGNDIEQCEKYTFLMDKLNEPKKTDLKGSLEEVLNPFFIIIPYHLVIKIGKSPIS